MRGWYHAAPGVAALPVVGYASGMPKPKGRTADGATPFVFERTMLVLDALDAHERAKDVFLEFGLPCFRCIVAEHETIEQGCVPLALDPGGVVKRLNALGATEASVAERRRALAADGSAPAAD